MKKYAFLICLLTLAGCGTVQQAQLNSASQKAQLEIAQQCGPLLDLSAEESAAWQALKNDTSCSAGIPEPWPQDKMMEISQCNAKKLNAKIKPVTYSPKRFSEYMAARESGHRQYAQGKVSWEEANVATMQRLENYFKNATGGSYYEWAKCSNGVINRVVMPAYQHKPLLMEYMANLSAMTRQADKDNLPKEDVEIKQAQLWSDFIAKEQVAIRQAQQQNAAAWQNVSNQLNAMQQQENARRNQCSSISLAPLAKPGCKNMCINGNWAEVC